MKPMNILKEINTDSEEKEIIDKLNERLKTLSTFEDLEKFLADMEKGGYGHVLVSKRTKWHAYAFTDAGDNKVHYLLSDGESTRTQKVKDLYRWLTVSNTSR